MSHPSFPEKREHRRRIARADLRLPFVVYAVAGLFGLGLMALLTWLDAPYLSIIGAILLLGYLALAIGLYLRILRYTRAGRAEEVAEQSGTDIYRLFRSSVDIPYAVVNSEGTVRVVNESLLGILGHGSAVCSYPLRDICGDLGMDAVMADAQGRDLSSIADIPPAPAARAAETADDRVMVVRLRNGRRYRVESYLFRRPHDHYYLLIFRDVNDYLDLLDRVDRERVVLAYIMLDNLQELTQFVRANYRDTANRVEEILSGWVSGMNGMLREYDRDKYLAVFSAEKLEQCIKAGFPILNDIMQIHAGDNSFPVSVSMGIADIDGTMQERERVANTALEMALQRGGNQVALQRRGGNGPVYFGGAHKTLESNTSISSRVSSHLLQKRLEACTSVLVMSHADPDFDAIGSAVGIYRLCRSMLSEFKHEDVPVRIVMNKSCETYRICRNHLNTLPEYDDVFLDKLEAQQVVTSRTLLILTDVSNPVIFESPALIDSIPAQDGVHPIAVIDHHRLFSELPFTPFLHYIEATKSSASEIVGEIFQQSDFADTLCKEEANLLLAGIMLDTHNFTRAAGSQTFDVTYYLYSRNAHTDVVREFFNESVEDLRIAGDFDANIEVYRDVFAISHLSDSHTPSAGDRIAASKAADKMLSIRGIGASFAFAVIDQNVAISARSKGRINVQLIMEKLDGGGHFDMAGAQILGSIEEARESLLVAIEEYRSHFPEHCRAED